jgi:hypothetical protein
MNVEFLMAARNRIVYQGTTTMTAAFMDTGDDDEFAEEEHRGSPSRPALDAIELLIAEKVDEGETLPITNPEGFGAARWLAQTNLSVLPDPIPRAFVLYLARAWAERGTYPDFKTALTEILDTRTFV